MRFGRTDGHEECNSRIFNNLDFHRLITKPHVSKASRTCAMQLTHFSTSAAYFRWPPSIYIWVTRLACLCKCDISKCGSSYSCWSNLPNTLHIRYICVLYCNLLLVTTWSLVDGCRRFGETLLKIQLYISVKSSNSAATLWMPHSMDLQRCDNPILFVIPSFLLGTFICREEAEIIRYVFLWCIKSALVGKKCCV
jgi:hypothetical protein